MRAWVAGRIYTDEAGDTLCYMHIPDVLAIIMLVADALLSLCYVALFLVPLRALARGNMGKVLEDMIRRNFRVCLVSITLTLVFVLYVVSTPLFFSFLVPVLPVSCTDQCLRPL